MLASPSELQTTPWGGMRLDGLSLEIQLFRPCEEFEIGRNFITRIPYLSHFVITASPILI